MTNGTMSLMPASVTANLDGFGNLSQAVTSNLDPATVPTGNQWRCDLRILGASVESFVFPVPPIQIETNGSIEAGALNVVQLSSLTAEAFMVGQSIVSSPHIPSNTTVLSVNTTANTVTMSANGTTGTDLSITLGTTIDLGSLLPAASQVN